MNRRYFGFAAFSILTTVFSACTANEDIEEPNAYSTEKNAISFRVENSSTARTSATHFTGIEETGFKVLALDQDGKYYSSPMDVYSTDHGTSWISSNISYWPSGQPSDWKGLTFIAFADRNPNSNTFRINDGTASLINYEVPSEVSSQSDLMYAVAKDVKNDSSNGGVSLRFRNALAQVSFYAQNNSPAYQNIEILSIELSGIKGIGTYTFPLASTNSSAKGAWTLDTNASDCSYIIENIGIDLGACENGDHGEKVNISSPTRSDSDYTMYLIPQTIKKGAYVKVTSIKTLNESPDTGYISEDIFPLSIDWKEGQQYNYNITWDTTPIAFNVSVADFDEVIMNAEL